MEPLDLTRHPPRSGYVKVGGLLLLARTIDKMRARLPGGNPGVYFINGPILGISGFLLQRLGIDEGLLQTVVAEAADEAEVIAWVRAHSNTALYDTMNAALCRIEIRHAEDPEFVRETYAPTLAARPELVRILDILDEDDRRMFELPTP